MVYYCNYSVIGCCEEMLKGLKYVKKDKYYNVSNGLGLDENKFKARRGKVFRAALLTSQL